MFCLSLLDVFEDFISPVTLAQTVLHSSASKRKEVLSKPAMIIFLLSLVVLVLANME